jgi:hypothetical protein
MKRLTLISILTMGLALLALAAVPVPLQLVPPDSQMIFEVHDGAFFHSLIRDAGMEPQLVEAVREMMSEIDPEKAKAFGPDEVRLMMDAGMVVGISMYDRGEETPGFRMFTGMEFKNPEAFRIMADMFTPQMSEEYIASSMGPFTIYQSRPPQSTPGAAGDATAQPAEQVWFAMGQQMIMLSVGDDFTKRLASFLAGRLTYSWDTMSFPGEDPAALGTLLRARIVTEDLKYAIKAAFMRTLEKDKKEKAEAEEGGEQAEASPFDIPPDAILKFVEGIGLGQVTEGTLKLRNDGENITVTAGMAVDRSQKMIGHYLQGISGRTISAYKLLPADTVAFNNFAFWDFGLFYQLLTELIKSSFGPQGESMLLSMEAMVPMQTGLSLRAELLPVLGNEHGMVMVPPSALGGAGSEAGKFPPAAIFMRPLKVELLDKAMSSLEKSVGLKIQRSTVEGKAFYEIDLSEDAPAEKTESGGEAVAEPAEAGAQEAEQDVTDALLKDTKVYMMTIEPLVFVSPNRAVLEHILAEGLKGSTLVNSSKFGDVMKGVNPGCVQLAAADMQGLGMVWDSLPADIPMVDGLKALFGEAGQPGISTQQIYVVDKGLVAQGRMPLQSFKDWTKGFLLLFEKAAAESEEQPEPDGDEK